MSVCKETDDHKPGIDPASGLSRGQADTGTLPQSITVTFDGPQRLSGVHIYWEKDSTWHTYDVEESEDGKVWKQMGATKSVTGNETDPVAFRTTNTLYFRIMIRDVKTGTGAIAIGMAELKLF